jgi:hypothetical protein
MIRGFAVILLAVVLSSFGVSMLNRSSLVAYYPMTQQTGNVLLDMKGGDKLVGQGNPYIVNASAYCNGTSSAYTASNQLAVKSLTNMFTISFWGKRNTTTSPCFIGTYDASTNISIWNVQNTATSGVFQMNIISSPAVNNLMQDLTTTYTSPMIWRHFVAVYDGTQATASNRVKLYVNGKNVVGTMTGTIPTTLLNPTNSTFAIGRGPLTFAGNSHIKFVELYNRPLTPTEVKNIYVEEYNKIQQSGQ